MDQEKIKCPLCGTIFDSADRKETGTCPNCGAVCTITQGDVSDIEEMNLVCSKYDQEENKRKKKKEIIIVVIAVASLLLLIALTGMFMFWATTYAPPTANGTGFNII